MEIVERISELTKKDRFFVCVSVLEEGKIKTKCMTNTFPYADLGIVKQAIIENIDNIAKKSAPPKPSSLT
tara:strand:- start:464 stop:673 length:210 start_codon:yes stop_codon:yes gene_type:complete